MEDFVSSCLRSPELSVPDCKSLLAGLKPFVTKVVKSNPRTGYMNVCELMNQVEQRLEKKQRYTEKLVFLDMHHQPPAKHPLGHKDAPDFWVVAEALFNMAQKDDFVLRWHMLTSVGEYKNRKITDTEQFQTVAFGGSLSQARVHNPAVLFFSVSPEQYIIGYLDPSGYRRSDVYGWKNLRPLVAYIHSLHQPLLTMEHGSLKPINDKSDTPRWLLQDSFGSSEFEVNLVGPAQSRMTTVMRCLKPPSPYQHLVLKLSYPSAHCPVSELELFKASTKNWTTLAPGWVKTLKPEEPSAPGLTTPLRGDTQRQVTIQVMTSTGTSFSQCSSLSELFKACYDILEASRWAIKHRRVLHRDISPGNILIRPSKEALPQGEHCFINRLLNPTLQSVPAAILLDLDSGARSSDYQTFEEIASRTDKASLNLRARSGTPLFIARGPSCGKYVGSEPITYPYLPVPEPDERERYVQAHQNDPFRKAVGSVGQCDQDLLACAAGQPLIQRPWHDAESLLFVLTISLLRYKPKNSDTEDANETSMKQLFRLLLQHQIGVYPDPRHFLFMPQAIYDTIHPDFYPVAGIIEAMFKDTFHDYEFLVPAQDMERELVLHEMLQRRLFQVCFKISRGIIPDIAFSDELRPIESPSLGDGHRLLRLFYSNTEPFREQQSIGVSRNTGRTTKKKRKQDDDDDQAEDDQQRKKRPKARKGEPSQPPRRSLRLQRNTGDRVANNQQRKKKSRA